ncbi:MAG: PQQ-dependent sugar dehydrogenase [Longimicrobiales bacterium]
MKRTRFRAAPMVALLVTAAACAPQTEEAADGGAPAGTPAAEGAGIAADPAACAADNGGITLPAGFCASVFADLDGRVRHVVVREDGAVFVSVAAGRDGNPPGGVVAMRDTDADGVADVTERFGPANGGTGIDLRGETFYFATDDAVLRYQLPADVLTPASGPDTIVSGLPDDRSHTAHSIALSQDGARIFVNIGSPTNSCQSEDRQAGVVGQDPCTQLDTRAGIWVFDANRTGQTQADGERFATGIRNAVAITIHPQNGTHYVAQHGRDNLFQNWPEYFDEVESAEMPGEEFLQVEQGDDFGWPYCFYNTHTDTKVLAPEYGGDGQEVGRCADKKDPVYAFPGHWAPNDLLFYTGSMFPERYRNGVFFAFHGSWNRAPEPQGGYNVAFLPLQNGQPAGDHEIFANGFAGATVQPGEAAHRPTGLAQGPDGALYITDDQAGRVWRVVYTGS